jgi:type III secretory pathway component EscT
VSPARFERPVIWGLFFGVVDGLITSAGALIASRLGEQLLSVNRPRYRRASQPVSIFSLGVRVPVFFTKGRLALTLRACSARLEVILCARIFPMLQQAITLPGWTTTHRQTTRHD